MKRGVHVLVTIVVVACAALVAPSTTARVAPASNLQIVTSGQDDVAAKPVGRKLNPQGMCVRGLTFCP